LIKLNTNLKLQLLSEFLINKMVDKTVFLTKKVEEAQRFEESLKFGEAITIYEGVVKEPL
jgi:hypothetical protein